MKRTTEFLTFRFVSADLFFSYALKLALLVTASILLHSTAIFSQHAPLSLAMNLSTGTGHRAWIFLSRRDNSKGTYRELLSNLDEKAVQRRIRVRGQAVSNNDLPPHPDDIAYIREKGLKIRVISRWLNAVSVQGDSLTIVRLGDYAHVRRVRFFGSTAKLAPLPRPEQRRILEIDTSAYGAAWPQDSLIGAPQAHELGFTGAGVRVGFLDAGFNNYDNHIAFEHLTVVDTWNALDSTSEVQTNPHGTHVLSVTAGLDSGNFIGIAPNIEVLLVRTEDSNAEYPQEEDFWVAGLEWAEEHGADLISTSLGYYDWYEPSDMDGNTAVTTIAADAAAARGLLVVTSAGNRGTDGLGAPADGDSVLTVGATDYDGQHVNFSSVGPTADGRIKPDVATVGENVVLVDDETTDGYLLGNGTSFSCPAVTGAAALLLEANPDLLPMEIINALRNTASQAGNPDTLNGWGVPNIPSALNYLAVARGGSHGVPSTFNVIEVYPNPVNSTTHLRFRLNSADNVEIRLYDLLGRLIRSDSVLKQRGAHDMSLPLGQLPSGLYAVTVSTSRWGQAVRIIVVR